VTEPIIFDAIQQITATNFKIKESLCTFLVANRDERIFHAGRCVFVPQREEPSDAETLAPLKAIKNYLSQKPLPAISEAELIALNVKLRARQKAWQNRNI
jgi:hypothetical protein